MQYYFAKLRHKSYKVIIPEFIVNSVSTVITVYLLIIYYCYYAHVEVTQEKFRSLETMLKMNEDEYCRFQTLFAIITATQIFRIFFLVRASTFLGPMIHILSKVFTQVGKFMIGIYLTLFLVFLSMGRVMFLQLPEFSSVGNAILSLFSASLGQFDFSVFRQRMVLEPKYGYLYLTIFLAFTNIVALNFAISILSHRFNELQNVNNALYLKQLLMIRQTLDVDEYYSGIVATFPPLNILNIPFALMLCRKKRKRLNKFVLNVFYIPVLFVGVIIFASISLALLPFSYIFSILEQVKNLFKRPAHKSELLINILILIFFVIFGAIILFAITIKDTIFFVLSCYHTKLKLRNVNSTRVSRIYNKRIEEEKTESRCYDLLVEKLIMYKDKKVQANCMVDDFRNDLKVSESLQKLLFSTHLIKNDKQPFDRRDIANLVTKSTNRDGIFENVNMINEPCSEEETYKRIIDEFNILK